MEVTMHSIEIDTEIEKVYNVCANVLKWPEYFPPCKKAKIITENGNQQLIEITAKSNEEEFTWQSERILYPKNYRIEFHQSTPGPLVKYMQGIWHVFKLNRGVLLSLQHTFEVKDNVENLINNVQNKEDALQFMHQSIDSNTKQELGAIKKLLENDGLRNLEAKFTAEIDIKATAEQVFNLLYNIKDWPNILPHCEKITVLYEDGCNQEFEMTVVNAEGKSEVMRSIRHGYVNTMIEYFQPSPPPVLKQHAGKWTINETESGIHLEAWHSITLCEDGVRNVWGEIGSEKALHRVVQAITKNSMATMQTIKSYFN